MNLCFFKEMMSIYIWCSWYYYSAWKEKFYPAGLPSSKWLMYYAEHFNTLEINSTFYKFPTLEWLQKRYRSVPEGFRFTIKAPKLLTHTKRMNNIGEDILLLYDRVEEWLAEKGLSILFQFPPSFVYTQENLQNILSVDVSRITHVFEFRNMSRYRQDVYTALQQAWIIWCNVSHPLFDDTYISSTPLIYLRMHGKKELFKSAYWKEWLLPWITHLKREEAKHILVYFNNTWYGEAIHDANLLKSLLYQ